MRPRRRILVGAAVLASVALVGLVALSTVPPWLARRELARSASRLGASVVAEEVRGSPGRVSVSGLRVTPRGSGPPLLEVERIDIRYALLPLVWGEVRLEEVRILRPRVRADLEGPRAVSSLARFLRSVRGDRRGSPASTRSGHPEIRLTRGTVEISDARGLAVSVKDVEGRIGSGGDARLGLHGVTVGPTLDDSWLSLLDVELGSPSIGEPAESVQVTGGSVRLRRHGDGSYEMAETWRVALALADDLLPPSDSDESEAKQRRLPAVSFAAIRVEVDDLPRGRRMTLSPVTGQLRPLERPTSAEVSLDVSLGGGRAMLAGTVDVAGGSMDVRLQMQDASLDSVLPFWAPPDWLGLEGALLAGDLHVVADVVAEDLGLEGEVEARGVDLNVPEIARQPLEDLTLRFEGRMRVREGAADWEVPTARVALAGIDGRVSGNARIADGTVQGASLDFVLPPTPCEELLRRMPEPLVSQLYGFRLYGSFGFGLRLMFDRADLDATELDFDVDNRCRVVAGGGVERFRGVFTRWVPDGEGGQRPFTTGPGSESWTPYEEISPFLVGAVLTTEDGGFFSHRGFAPRQIRSAFVRDLRSGRFSAGASTISMQLAKNVYLSREKTLARKLQEAFFTWLLEQSMSKAEILELYLNVIEFGPGIYGVRNAADHFFGVGPSGLSPAQGIYLATVLPDPVSRYAQFERGRPWESTTNRIRRIAELMAARGRLSGLTADEALDEPLIFRGQGAIAESDVAGGGQAEPPYTGIY